MPTVQEIEIAALRLRRENRRVSVRNVRSALPRGGSYTDIGPVLAAWKAKTNYRPKELPKDVPPAMAAAIEEFAVKVWAVARDEAEKVVEHRMLEQAELEREFEKEAAVAWAEVDRLMDEVRDLRSKLGAAGIRTDRPLHPVFNTARRAPPAVPAPATVPVTSIQPLESWRALAFEDVSAKVFWDGLLDEVTLVIEASGKEALSSREIFDGLPSPVSAKFADFKGGENRAWSGKLKAWAQEGTRIRVRDDGLYALASNP